MADVGETPTAGMKILDIHGKPSYEEMGYFILLDFSSHNYDFILGSRSLWRRPGTVD